jgi:SAM-dependent methyltransferase
MKKSKYDHIPPSRESFVNSLYLKVRTKLKNETKLFLSKLETAHALYLKNKYTRYFEGKQGLEIGGPSSIFRKDGILPFYESVAHLDNCNFCAETVWSEKFQEGKTFQFSKNKECGLQILCEVTDLNKIDSEKYDFVLASHVLEHVANPLKALQEIRRVTKKNGFLLVIVPEKKNTFDWQRPTTRFEHLLEDYKNNMPESDLTHLPEILQLHDLTRDVQAGSFEEFKKRSLDNYRNRCLHQHVFDENLVRQTFNYLDIHLILARRMAPHHQIFLGKKQ